MGGRDKIRPLIKHYYKDTQSLIFVVDSNDSSRLDFAADELHRMCKKDTIDGIPLLVVCNKQDLPNALSLTELTERLQLRDINERRMSVVGVSASTEEGTDNALQQLEELVLNPDPSSMTQVAKTKLEPPHLPPWPAYGLTEKDGI